MSQYTLPPSEKKPIKPKKHYDLDRNFIKLYKITDYTDGPGYERKELYQDDDFADQEDADVFYKICYVMPYIFYILSDKENKTYRDHKIKKIFVKFCNKDCMPYKVPYGAFELFREQVWIDIGHSDSLGASLDEDYYKDRLEDLKSRDKEDNPSHIYSMGLPVENIWNEYCLLEGKTTISRDNFVLWLYRLNCLIFDLLEHPYFSDTNWQRRLKVIKGFLKDKYSGEYEYFDVDRWKLALKNKRFDKNMAFKERLKDGQKLLNDFFGEVKIESALEDLLKSFYMSFAEELHNKGLLTRCGYCGAFIPFIKNKKYCSLLNEGRDCGKKARNQKYYSTRGKSRLPIYRRKTRALRKYYKEKGITK